MCADPPSLAGAGTKLPPHLLVVDDELVFRQEFTSLLQEEGYRVDAAGSVDNAMDMLGRQRFDVLLCDNKMPRKSGQVLVEAVLDRWPAMYVMNITGQPTERAARNMMEKGGLYFLSKPFRFDEARQVLDDIRAEMELEERLAPSMGLTEALRLATSDGREVGLLSGGGPRAFPGALDLEWDPSDLATASKAVGSFKAKVRRPTLLFPIEGTLVGRHGRAAVVGLARELRRQMDGHGPVVLGVPSQAFSHLEVLVLRESLSRPAESFGGHGAVGRRRRAIVHALRSGPKSGKDLTANIFGHETAQAVFYFDNLVSHDILRFDGSTYQLTSHGEKVSEVLSQISASPDRAEDGSRLFTWAG